MTEREPFLFHYEGQGGTQLISISVGAEEHWRMPPSQLADITMLGHLHATSITEAKVPWPRYIPLPPMSSWCPPLPFSPFLYRLSSPVLKFLSSLDLHHFSSGQL